MEEDGGRSYMQWANIVSFLRALYQTDTRDECRALASVQITIVSFEIIEGKREGGAKLAPPATP